MLIPMMIFGGVGLLWSVGLAAAATAAVRSQAGRTLRRTE